MLLPSSVKYALILSKLGNNHYLELGRKVSETEYLAINAWEINDSKIKNIIVKWQKIVDARFLAQDFNQELQTYFLELFAQEKNNYDFAVKYNDVVYAFNGFAERTVWPSLEFALENNKVSLKPQYFLKSSDAENLVSGFTFFEYIYVPQEGLFFKAEPTPQFKTFSASDYYKDMRTWLRLNVPIAVEKFNTFSPVLPLDTLQGFLAVLSFSKDVHPQVLPPKLVINAIGDDAYSFQLQLEHNGQFYPVPIARVDDFINRFFFLPANTKFRRQRYYDLLALLSLAPDVLVAQQLVEDFSAQDAFFSEPAVKSKLIKNTEPIIQQLFAQDLYYLAAATADWFVVPALIRQLLAVVLNLERLVRLYHPKSNWSAVYKTADNPLKKATVFKILPEYSVILANLGITLLFNSQPLETMSLDFKVAVTPRPDRIDWFELQPEIACAGANFPVSEWRKIMNGEPVIETTTGKICVVDKNSLALLKYFDKDLHLNSISRLQIFDWLSLTKKGVTVNLPEEFKIIYAGLTQFKNISPQAVPETIAAVLRPYQQEGIDWLAFLYKHRFGACLADDMGLGKTLQIIGFLAAIKTKQLETNTPAPSLIVVPPTLLFNWVHEINKFYAQLQIIEYSGHKRSQDFTQADIVLTTYGLMLSDIEFFKTQHFNIIVFDEAQHLKNIHAERTQAARELHCRFKICLTGTPVENHVREYFAIIDLAVPGLLGSPRQFHTKLIEEKVIQQLADKSKPFVLRRTKKEILLDLPPKIETETYLEMSIKQKGYYTRVVAEVREEVAKAYKLKPQQQAGIIALSALLRLRQICLSPELIDANFTETTPKYEYLQSKLWELTQENNAALVFSQFVGSLDILEAQLIKHKITYVRIDPPFPNNCAQ